MTIRSFTFQECGREIRLDVGGAGCTYHTGGSDRPPEQVSLLQVLLAPYRVPAALRTEVARAVAEQWPGDGAPIQRRIAYLRALRPERMTPMQWTWRWLGGGEEREEQLSFGVDGVTWIRPHGRSMPISPDDAFVHGPPAPGMPRDARQQLRAVLRDVLDASAEIASDPGFIDLDYGRIAGGEWAHDPRSDGQAYVWLEGGGVEMGYRYGHDDGADTHSVERVWSAAPEVQWTAPVSIRDAVIARIAAARIL